MSTRAALLAFAAGLALACAPSPPAWRTSVRADDPLVGRIYDVAARRFLTPDDVVERAARVDFALFGEKHDNPDHHRLQAWLLEQLARRERRPAVVFEMIRVDREEALRSAPRDPDALAAALDWANSGWPEFALYRPVFAAALTAGMPLAAGDLSRAQLGELRKQGLDALGSEARARLAIDPGPSASERERLAEQVRLAHCGMAPEAMIDAMLEIQRARDAALADALLRAATLHGAVLIAGAGHVSRAQAVPLYLERRAPQRASFALAFLEAPREGSADPAELGEGFDVIWITPRVDDEDPCSRFRHDLEKIRGKGGERQPKDSSP